MHSRKKLNLVVLHLRFVRHISISSVSIGLHRCFQKPSQLNKIALKLKKMPRLNDDERNQTIGILNAGMSATVVSRHFGWTPKTIERLRRQFRVIGNVADRPQSGRSCVTTAADDRYIILQHLRNRRLSCSSNRKTVWHSSTDCQKLVETKCSTYSCIPTILRSNSQIFQIVHNVML